MSVCRCPIHLQVRITPKLFFVCLHCLSYKPNDSLYTAWRTCFPSWLRFYLEQCLHSREYRCRALLSQPHLAYIPPDCRASPYHPNIKTIHQSNTIRYEEQQFLGYYSHAWTWLHIDTYWSRTT